jgi:hypothetical protein
LLSKRSMQVQAGHCQSKIQLRTVSAAVAKPVARGTIIQTAPWVQAGPCRRGASPPVPGGVHQHTPSRLTIAPSTTTLLQGEHSNRVLPCSGHALSVGTQGQCPKTPLLCRINQTRLCCIGLIPESAVLPAQLLPCLESSH